MKLASEMKNLTEGLLVSFKNRIKENEELVVEVQKTLDGFRKDHQEMTDVLNANALALRKELATGEKERMGAFNNLMSDIHLTITNIKNEVTDIQASTNEMIREFLTDRLEMAVELDRSFAKNRTERGQDEKERMQEFVALMKSINNDIQGINDEVTGIFNNTNNMLARFDKEHLDMSVELRTELGKNLAERVGYTRILLNNFQKKLSDISKENQKIAQKLRKDLANGETDRLKDYSGIMKVIHQAIKEIEAEVKLIEIETDRVLDDLFENRVQASVDWTRMQEAMAMIRKTGTVQSSNEMVGKAEKKKVTAKEVLDEPAKAVELIKVLETELLSAEIPAAPVIESSDEILASIELTPQAAITLEEKVLNYINKHPVKGVKVSDMEGPFGETRMKLGFVAKALLDQGKVQKIENYYFPLK